MEPAKVRDLIRGIESLPTLPVVLSRIIDIARDPDADAETLCEVISLDQALAERVSRVANSSFFGHSGKVGDIRQAVLLLGFSHICDIALSMSVVEAFSKRGDKNLKNFWLHSAEVAFLSSSVAESATMVSPGSAFLAGLLHDVGRLLFYRFAQQGYREILGTDDLLEREVSLFGCDHALAGSWLAEKTKLPMEHITAIRYHHTPSAAQDFRDLVSVVAISEALSRRASPKIEDDGMWSEEHDAILLELSLRNEDLAEIERMLGEKEVEMKAFLEMMW